MFYSQFGEDKILNDIFRGKTSGLCVEVGANNGMEDSTTLFFEQLGWKCILVEPNPDLCNVIKQRRKAKVYQCAASDKKGVVTLFVVEGAERSHGLSTISSDLEVHKRIESHGFNTSAIEVSTLSLNEIFEDAQINEPIDFISIDVEGHEKKVLEGLTLEKWKPTILLIEDNSNIENDAVHSYLKEYGYVRFKRTGVNDWYAHESNKQLINLKSDMLMKGTVVRYLLLNRYIILKSLIKKVMLKIPLLRNMVKSATSEGNKK